jgi:hypothetical protein
MSECSEALKGDIDRINSLRDDDMAYLMSMNTKELHKLCGRLKEDRFLAVYVSSIQRAADFLIPAL